MGGQKMKGKYRTLNRITNQGEVLFGGRIPFLEGALCRDDGVNPDSFFPPPRRHNNDARLAKKICSKCPVKLECLDHALTNNEEHGIWGGLGPEERKKLRRKRDAENNPSPVGNRSLAPNWRGIEATG